MAHVFFVCLHNAGRSQMSQALDRALAEQADVVEGVRVIRDEIAVRVEALVEELDRD
jgi:protein-tyrosine-phosphatase